MEQLTSIFNAWFFGIFRTFLIVVGILLLPSIVFNVLERIKESLDLRIRSKENPLSFDTSGKLLEERQPRLSEELALFSETRTSVDDQVLQKTPLPSKRRRLEKYLQRISKETKIPRSLHRRKRGRVRHRKKLPQ